MDALELKNIIKAVLISEKEPVPFDILLEVVDDVDDKQLKQTLRSLIDDNSDVFTLKKVASGYSYQLKEEYTKYCQKAKKINPEDEGFPRAFKETLAIIAYKQPISRGEIDLIRGCSTHQGVYESLLEKKWVEIVGYAGETRRAALYGTTMKFLDDMGITNIFDLPDLPPLPEIAECQK